MYEDYLEDPHYKDFRSFASILGPPALGICHVGVLKTVNRIISGIHAPLALKQQ